MALRISVFVFSIAVSALAGVGAFTLLHPQVSVSLAAKPPPGKESMWACWLDAKQESLRCADLEKVLKTYRLQLDLETQLELDEGIAL